MQATFGCCRLACLGCAHEGCEGELVSDAECQGGHHAGTAEPCPCEPQCRGVCNYVTGSKVRIEPPASSFSTAPAVVVPVNFAARSLETSLGDRWEPPGGESEPPLRLHLLNQVWLI